MALVSVKNKYQVVIPQKVREKIRLRVGDLLEARVERGKDHLHAEGGCAPRRLRKCGKPSTSKAGCFWKISIIPHCGPKKYDEALDLWQARVSRNGRSYFTLEDEEYRLHNVKPHPK